MFDWYRPGRLSPVGCRPTGDPRRLEGQRVVLARSTGIDRPQPDGATVSASIPAIEGLRALAVTMVVGRPPARRPVATSTPGWWPTGGWLGVDLFFVLSGFLITTLILEEQAPRGTSPSAGSSRATSAPPPRARSACSRLQSASTSWLPISTFSSDPQLDPGRPALRQPTGRCIGTASRSTLAGPPGRLRSRRSTGLRPRAGRHGGPLLTAPARRRGGAQRHRAPDRRRRGAPHAGCTGRATVSS